MIRDEQTTILRERAVEVLATSDLQSELAYFAQAVLALLRELRRCEQGKEKGHAC
jgi:hypothetical protein